MAGVGGLPVDRYVVLEHLSEGGMGAIYVGKKLGAGGFEMAVVLKQLLPEFTQQEEFIDLFLREAKLSATLDHANIVHTIDLVTAGGEYFIVMEYLPGGDLRTLVKRAKRRGERFSPAAAIYVCREVLSALSYAHSKRDFDGKPLRLIHRDVSPSNILVSYTGEVKLTDFGIAKAATHNSLFYKVKGKIGYMSPEQAKSEPLDHRSDLYSLAVCLYECLTGERLFVHAGLTTSAEEIYSQPIPTMSRKVPGMPPDMDAVMRKALAINPDERYQTAGEFNEALTRFAHKHGMLMSAPELAEVLNDIVGPREQWRDSDDEEEVAPANGAARPGTEVYDIAEEEEDDEDQINMGGPMSIHSIAAKMSANQRGSELGRPKTEIAKLQGVELTSIINMMDIDGAPQGEAARMSAIRPIAADLEPSFTGESRMPSQRMTGERMTAPRMSAAIERATAPRMTQDRMTAERMTAPKITAERITGQRVTAERVTGQRSAAHDVPEEDDEEDYAPPYEPPMELTPEPPYQSRSYEAPMELTPEPPPPPTRFPEPVRAPARARGGPTPMGVGQAGNLFGSAPQTGSNRVSGAPRPAMAPLPGPPQAQAFPPYQPVQPMPMPMAPVQPMPLPMAQARPATQSAPPQNRGMGMPQQGRGGMAIAPISSGMPVAAQAPHHRHDQHAPQTSRSKGRRPSKKRSLIRPWMVIAAILILTGIAVMAVAMSGPDVAVQRGK